ncbi:MAG TPA: ParB/RepB/Spo0J family partition protein [Crenalkalicoccus sp.]|nr:ParB/RepB/Spo0J family partition protein [Crenalkalicoccus sp.]
MATGAVVTRVHEFVDPARCRIWAGHNRDYAALDESNCSDLLESLRAQGRQEVPAIVRRVTDDQAVDFEVVCGARRHWSVSWLRRNGYPEFRFLVEPRELTDEEAFRVADLENRHRKDLTDYERALDYARALERYYGGSQQRMLERLNVSKSWLSRYLELAKLPPEVLGAYGSPQSVGISHAAQLAPVLKHPVRGRRLLDAAAALAEEQAAARKTGEPTLAPAAVTRRLLEAAAGSRPTHEIVIRGADESVLMRGQRGRGGALAITVPASATSSPDALVEAFTELLSRLAGKRPG